MWNLPPDRSYPFGMPDINELSERWTHSRKIWVDMNRAAADFGKRLIELWKKYLNMGPGDELVEPVPPNPERLSEIVGPRITTDPKSHRLADWMSEQFDVEDAVSFFQGDRRFGIGILTMIPSKNGSNPDFVPFFIAFINTGPKEYTVNLAGMDRRFRIRVDDPESFTDLFDFMYDTLLKRYPQSLEEMIEMFSGPGPEHIGFRPRFDE